MLEENLSVNQEQATPETEQVADPSSQNGESQSQAESQEPVEAATSEEAPATEENLPFGKHPRWIKMRESNKTLQSQIKQTQDQLSALEGAKHLDSWLRKNPDKIDMIKSWMSGKAEVKAAVESAAAEKDPYADFDPVVAERFRKQDILEKKLADMEAAAQRQQEQEQMSSLQKSVERAENKFSSLLSADGFVDKNGNGDTALVELIADATLSKIAKMTGEDPRFASDEQIAQAYKAVTGGLSAHQKYTLKKTVSNDVPLSGSNKGSIPRGKATMTEDERISSIANMLS